MATVQLGDTERLGHDLPDLCMKCGAPAMVYTPRTFSWHPSWVYVLLFAGVLPFILVALLLTRRRTLCVPLCHAHRNHWRSRFLILFGSFFGLFGLAFVLLLLAAPRSPFTRAYDFTGLICLGWVASLVVWLILAAVLSMTSVRTTRITDQSITLAGVADAFVAAFDEDRRQVSRAVERAVREHWRHDRNRPWQHPNRYRVDDWKPGRWKEHIGEEDP